MRGGAEEDTHAAALVALSLMSAVAWHFLLRGNLGARFGDMAPLVAVLGAYVLSMATAGHRPWPRVLASGAPAVAILAVTVACIWQLGSVSGELRTARLLEPFDVVRRVQQASRDLAEMPHSLRQSQGNDRAQAADYLHRCTRPTDRVIAIGYYPDVPAFSDRLFAGGRVTFVVGYYADPRYARETIAMLDSQSVPIVLGGELLDDPRLGLAEYFAAVRRGRQRLDHRRLASCAGSPWTGWDAVGSEWAPVLRILVVCPSRFTTGRSAPTPARMRAPGTGCRGRETAVEAGCERYSSS